MSGVNFKPYIQDDGKFYICISLHISWQMKSMGFADGDAKAAGPLLPPVVSFCPNLNHYFHLFLILTDNNRYFPHLNTFLTVKYSIFTYPELGFR